MQRANAKVVSSMLQQALEASVDLSKFPKAVLDVYCCVLEAGGAEEAAVITAASMAVADAGIELYDLVPACCVVSCTCQCVQQMVLSTIRHVTNMQQVLVYMQPPNAVLCILPNQLPDPAYRCMGYQLGLAGAVRW